MELSVVPYSTKLEQKESEDGDVVEEPRKNKWRNDKSRRNDSNETVGVRYRECMRNHAASLGGQASDGCGEFMRGAAGFSCAACGCHRNFHRREVAAAEFSGKRFRTKFSSEQKERMLAFAESIGWRIQRHYDSAINQFCSDIGVRRNVLKVWMHNNKTALRRTQSLPPPPPPPPSSS